MDEGGDRASGKDTGSSIAPMRDGGWGEGGWRAGGVSDRVVLSAPLWRALQGSPGACSVK